mmetsp:Transcript_64707/g.142799  ORF Transcript_64707/g.142799 Transcript_64707/m.142799 type:complete len:95 (-) Transcript_64707:887-1171(-)
MPTEMEKNKFRSTAWLFASCAIMRLRQKKMGVIQLDSKAPTKMEKQTPPHHPADLSPRAGRLENSEPSASTSAGLLDMKEALVKAPKLAATRLW